MSVVDWQVLTAYPMTSLVPDGARQRLRWFLKVKPGGTVEDLLTGTESSGLFVELLCTDPLRLPSVLLNVAQADEQAETRYYQA
jgi:hypothetical protein